VGLSCLNRTRARSLDDDNAVILGKEEPMVSLPTRIPACAINFDLLPPSPPICSSPIEPEASNDFALLVRLFQNNERLFAERQALLDRLQRARLYLADPHANLNLAKANLQHLKTKYSGILALLRANRREAQALLARLESVPGEKAEPSPSSTEQSVVPDPRCLPSKPF
jgi:hypothetical protein